MSYNASGTIHMYDDGAYIRVTNDNSPTVVNYIKATLLIQKDSDGRFFLKNDSFINYYNYNDVSTPFSSSIDDLISQLKAWNTTTSFSGNVTIQNSNLPVNVTNSTIQTTLPLSLIDQFQRLRVSTTPTTLLNLSTQFGVEPTQIAEWTFKDAYSSNDTYKGHVGMSISTSNGSHIIRQSKVYAPYVYGSTNTAIISGQLINDVTIPGVMSRIGVFDDSNYNEGSQPIGNGLCFQWNYDNGLSVVYRTNFSGNMTDYDVQQASWNLDILNGTGASGFSYDVSATYNFVFEWNQANPGSARVGIMGHKSDTSEDGVIWCHHFLNALPFGNPSLPLRWDIVATNDNIGGAGMVQGSAVIYSNKLEKETNKVFQVSMGSNLQMLTSPGRQPLFSISLRPGCERAKLKPRNLHIASGGFGYWELCMNQNFNVTNWNNINSAISYARWDKDATDSSSGYVITSGYIYDASSQTINLEDYNVTLTSDVYGVVDTLTLALVNVNGVLNVSASMDWYEIP